MAEPAHTSELKVWFITEASAHIFLNAVDRSSWAGSDPALEGRVRGKIVTLAGSNAEIMGRIVYEHVAWRLARGFVTKAQMSGGPS